ncbi:MAG: LysM peptidoglycan-binding domain-containing protein [Gemmatimonadales bacterium]|nr:MAG: LysM peptidoglycan-binding domain-containing protein [Gemmatimonadales bacterium]
MQGNRMNRLSLMLGMLLPVAAACSTGPAPVTAPDLGQSPNSAQAESRIITKAELADLDSAVVEQAAGDAELAIETLDDTTRREFYTLFGSDPLGLSKRPVNAGQVEIPLEMNAQVERWIEFFTTGKGRDRFAIYLQRAGRYEGMIRKKAHDAQLPEDLLYLAMIESGMNPNAYSRARAVGLWQFIASTGRAYGLEVSYWMDERRDPFRATDAAIAHLGDLYERFGSWYLAAAAYNAGAGRVSRGIQRTGSDDFWDLSDARVLRSETRNYVPKLLAAAIVARNAVEYGFGDVEPMPPLEFDVVHVPDATSFDVLADAAEVTEAEIRDLNPHFPRQVTPPDREVDLRVPVGRADIFATNYARVPASERVTWLEHVVTRGQTLGAIANRYGTSVAAIRATNNNVSPRRLQIGQRLVIPRSRAARVASASSVGPSETLVPPDGPLTVTVQPGDTLWALARQYGTSTQSLMAMNSLGSSVIRPGDRIMIRR